MTLPYIAQRVPADETIALLFHGHGQLVFCLWTQSVIFAWLVTMVLQESAEKVGLAQMAFLLPATLLMLLGGSLADHFGGKRLAIIGHLVAATAPLFLTVVTWLGGMSYTTVIIFAVVMGCAQALVTPARDGLIANLAGGKHSTPCCSGKHDSVWSSDDGVSSCFVC